MSNTTDILSTIADITMAGTAVWAAFKANDWLKDWIMLNLSLERFMTCIKDTQKSCVMLKSRIEYSRIRKV